MDAWLTRMYERHGVRWMLLAAQGVVILGVIPAGAVVPARLEGLSLSKYLLIVGVAEAITVVTNVVGGFRERATLRPLFAWERSTERGEAAADAALQASFAIVPRFVSRTAVPVAAATVPFAVFICSLGRHFTLADVVLVAAGGALLAAYALLFYFFFVEVAMRPVRVALSAARSSSAGTQEQGIRLEAKLVVGLVSLTVLAGFTCGAFILDYGSGASGLARAFAWALAISAVYAVSFALFLGLAILGPVRDLIVGTRAVATGDLAARVPVTSSDQLGTLASSFNAMLDGLRERESLREHNVELVDELQASRARIVAAADAERRRVERDLHDGAQQNLVLLNLELGVIERAVEGDPETRAMVAQARADLGRALAALRDLAHGIYPAVLTSDGLPGALSEAVEGAAIPASLDCDGAGRYRPELEAAVYFCCLEALQNAAKHAGDGATVAISLAEQAGELSFAVRDDGRGFDVAARWDSSGVRNMADRIGALGGELRVESAPGRGTSVSGSVPVGGAEGAEP